MLDIDKLRADCQACQSLVHFNNAGCSLTPDPVQALLLEHLALEQSKGGYEAAVIAREGMENFYSALARLLNCDDSEIAFVENATRAWDMALHSIQFESGDQILTGEMEYASNYLELLHLSRRYGTEIVLVPSDQQGRIDLDALRKAIGKRSKLIALTHVASQCGDIQPAQEVGAIAREHDLFYLLDACQSVGQLPLDVTTLACDFLCGSGRKYLRGPRGTGFLYVRKERLAQLDPVFIDLQAASWDDAANYTLEAGARRFETWERHVAGMIALGAAADYAVNIGLAQIAQRIQALARQLHDGLSAIDGITVHERSRDLSGIVTFSKQDEAAEALQNRLRSLAINTSVSRQAVARLDRTREQYGDINRASLHYFNTAEEIDRLLQALQQA